MYTSIFLQLNLFISVIHLTIFLIYSVIMIEAFCDSEMYEIKYKLKNLNKNIQVSL